MIDDSPVVNPLTARVKNFLGTKELYILSRLEFNLLAGWLRWLINNRHSRQEELMLDDAYNLLIEYDRAKPRGLSGNWREIIWEFTAFLVDQNFFDDEPTAGEVKHWLDEFATSADCPFNDTNTPTFRAKFANKEI